MSLRFKQHSVLPGFGLGLGYSLLTQYTSFIAVDQQVRNPDPQGSTQVQQPLQAAVEPGNLRTLPLRTQVSSTGRRVSTSTRKCRAMSRKGTIFLSRRYCLT